MPKPRLPWTIAPGCVLTAGKAEVLRQLSLCGEAGSGAVAVVLPRGTLAILVQFGVAEYADGLSDRLGVGERRYRVTERGREVLGQLGMLS